MTTTSDTAGFVRLKRLYEYAKEILGRDAGPGLVRAMEPLADAGVDVDPRWHPTDPDDEDETCIVFAVEAAQPQAPTWDALLTDSFHRFSARIEAPSPDGLTRDRWQKIEMGWAVAVADSTVAAICRRYGVSPRCPEAQEFTRRLIASIDEMEIG